jgi:hypothetical protein
MPVQLVTKPATSAQDNGVLDLDPMVCEAGGKELDGKTRIVGWETNKFRFDRRICVRASGRIGVVPCCEVTRDIADSLGAAKILREIQLV